VILKLVEFTDASTFGQQVLLPGTRSS